MDMIAAVAAKKLGKFLAKDFREIFGSSQNDEAERLGALARTTIECIARSDALYHTYEHTMLVSMVGRDILRGRTLAHTVQPEDYIHLIVACLLHDIGFVRGVLSGDTKTEFVIDKNGRTVTLPRGASDASLAPYHVDRSKLFVYERLGKFNNDRPRPCRCGDRAHAAFRGARFGRNQTGLRTEAGPAADLDRAARRSFLYLPEGRMRCLSIEFEELGRNRQFGYCFSCRPGREVSGFYWNTVQGISRRG